MPLNVPGILVPLNLLVNPRLVVPHLVVKDIRQIDFRRLREAGYRGAVFDKDNCLTIPYEDTLVPELKDAWATCRETFGKENVLIVSNSAGTASDPGAIQAESVSHHLGVPVLNHPSRKPSFKTARGIQSYFSDRSVPVRTDELVVIGDRLFTDVVLARRLRGKEQPSAGPTEAEKLDLSSVPRGPLAVWTTGLWKREALLMRWCEKQLLSAVERWSTPSSRELEVLEHCRHFIIP